MFWFPYCCCEKTILTKGNLRETSLFHLTGYSTSQGNLGGDLNLSGSAASWLAPRLMLS